MKILLDPHYYDPKIAGWWVWGISQWIGDGWCDTDRQTPIVWRQRPQLKPQGVQRKVPSLQKYGKGIHCLSRRQHLEYWFGRLAERLRYVSVCCGDWTRVLTTGVLNQRGYTNLILLDPPYDHDRRVVSRRKLYRHDVAGLSAAVRAWCKDHGDRPDCRIALCGLDGEHDELQTLGWTSITWKKNPGYATFHRRVKSHNSSFNLHPYKTPATQERIWFSPHCLATFSDLVHASGILDPAPMAEEKEPHD